MVSQRTGSRGGHQDRAPVCQIQDEKPQHGTSLLPAAEPDQENPGHQRDAGATATVRELSLHRQHRRGEEALEAGGHQRKEAEVGFEAGGRREEKYV